MQFNPCPFCGEVDMARMLALAHVQAARNLHVVDLPYRLSSWALDDPRNACLWETDAGDLAAWAVLQSPFWTIDYALACPPSVERDLHRRVLAWADERARALLDDPAGHPCWFVNVLAGEAARRDDLHGMGFNDQADVGDDSWVKWLSQRPAALPVDAGPLPPGFCIRELDGAREVPAYVELHQAAFESRNMTAGWRGRTLQRDSYRPELDLVVAASDGTLAAFCVAWFDPAGRDGAPAGQIEPLGVRPGYHRHGLGRAILAESLRRLAALGAQRIYVETENQRSPALALYGDAGFMPALEARVYRKDYRRE